MESYHDALKTSGVGVTGRLNKLQRTGVVIRRHEALGKTKLDDKVVAEYIRKSVSDLTQEKSEKIMLY